MGRGQGDLARPLATRLDGLADRSGGIRHGAEGAAMSKESRRRVLEELSALWQETYEVGGSVRDELMGRDPKDLDIAVCGLTYDQLVEILDQEGHFEELTVIGNDGVRQLVGVRFRAPWTPREGIEIALARTEVSTGPRYQDFAIRPDPRISIADDLARRDFTCNAIARPARGGDLIDPFGGDQDIRHGILRQVSSDTFRDDPLRTVRALARIGKDGLEPEPETERSMQRFAPGLRDLPGEQIAKQLKGALAGPFAGKAFDVALRTGVLAQLVPAWGEKRPAAIKRGAEAALARAAEEKMDGRVQLTLLLTPLRSPEPAAKKLVKDLRLCGEDSADIPYLAAHNDRNLSLGFGKQDEAGKIRAARRFLAIHGAERARLLSQLHLAEQPESEAPPARQFAQSLERELAKGFPLSVKDLDLSGHDLIALGLEGRAIGEAQRDLLRQLQVSEDPYGENRRERLLAKLSV